MGGAAARTKRSTTSTSRIPFDVRGGAGPAGRGGGGRHARQQSAMEQPNDCTAHAQLLQWRCHAPTSPPPPPLDARRPPDAVAGNGNASSDDRVFISKSPGQFATAARLPLLLPPPTPPPRRCAGVASAVPSRRRHDGAGEERASAPSCAWRSTSCCSAWSHREKSSADDGTRISYAVSRGGAPAAVCSTNSCRAASTSLTRRRLDNGSVKRPKRSSCPGQSQAHRW